MHKILAPLFLAGLATLAVAPAAEARGVPCGERDSMVRELEARYGETRRSWGIARAQGLFELFAADNGGSWTLLLTTPSGKTCMMAAGEAWERDPPVEIDAPA